MSEEIRGLVLDIYDCVADPGRWPKVLDKVGQRAGALGMILYELQQQRTARDISPVTHSTIYPPPVLAYYTKQFRDQELEENDRVERLVRPVDDIEVVRDTDLFDDPDELLIRPNVKALAGFDIRHRAFGLLDKDIRGRSRFSISHTGKHGPMTDAERAVLAELLPHMAKAIDLGRPAATMARQNRALLAAMDQLRIGVCILDGRGFVVSENAEFARQREVHTAFRIDPTGRLALGEQADGRHYEALLTDALNHGRHGGRPRKEAVALEGPEGPGALCLEIAPLAQAEEIGSQPLEGSIVYSLDTTLPIAIDTGPTAQVFGLTEAETALTALLAEGLTNAQIAERRDRKLETVNAQVKTILAKTGCANRTQLVRLLVSFSASFLRAGD